MTAKVFIFPGQGSQKIGMLSDLMHISIIKQTFTQAAEILSLDIDKILNNPQELNLTYNTQPIILTASIALWRLWHDMQLPSPIMMAGHSLGEYSALVCAESITFADALILVQKRGQYMQQAVPQGKGKMIAVIGLNDNTVIDICDLISSETQQIISAANFNAPNQIVVAGETQAIEQSIEVFKQHGALRVIPLTVSVPSHCLLMEKAAQKLKLQLKKIAFNKPKIPVVQNFTASVELEPQKIQNNLVNQLYTPVRWVESIHRLIQTGTYLFYECGPGKILSGLNRYILKKITTIAMDSPSIYSKIKKNMENM